MIPSPNSWSSGLVQLEQHFPTAKTMQCVALLLLTVSVVFLIVLSMYHLRRLLDGTSGSFRQEDRPTSHEVEVAAVCVIRKDTRLPVLGRADRQLGDGA